MAMQQYKYTAIDVKKKKHSGIFIAKDTTDLATALSKQGLFLLDAKLYSGKTPSAFFTLGTGGVKLSDLTSFCRQFSIMINSGISVVDCLEVLKTQDFTGYFRKLISMVCEDVKGGMMLSAAFSKHKKAFPSFFCSMISVGEESGGLDEVFVSLADYYEKDSALKRKARGAFAYPLMLLLMTVVIVALLLVFVIPTFRATLDELGVELTGFTRAVYSFSDFVLSYWLYILAGIILLALIIFSFGKTKIGAFFFDWLKLKTPYVKGIYKDLISARFARGLALLLSSGIDISHAMKEVTVLLENRDIESRFSKAASDVEQGSGLAESFEKHKLFPPIMIQMISVGEKTASLEDTLMRSCNFFDEQLESSLTSVTSKIQPIMLLILGFIIILMFLAILSPMLSIMTGLNV